MQGRPAMSGAVTIMLPEEDAAVLLDLLADMIVVLGADDDRERSALVSAAAQLRQGLRGRS